MQALSSAARAAPFASVAHRRQRAGGLLVVQAARVANKDLLAVAEEAAAAGAKVCFFHRLPSCIPPVPLTAVSAPILTALHPHTPPTPPTAPVIRSHPQLILEAVDRPRNIQYKGAAGSTSDLVTDTDRASEEAILGVLQRAFPGHAILGEEGGVYGAWGRAAGW